MSKCYVCKSNRRQLLMLTCSHDVCIKCAADNYFLNNVGKIESRKDDKRITKIDQKTINQLKQWYITNVNPKTSSKPKQNSDSNPKQFSKSPDPIIESKPTIRSKPSQNHQQFNPISNEQNSIDRRYNQKNRDFQQERNYRNSNNIRQNNEYDQRGNYHYQEYGQKLEKQQRNDKKNQEMYRMPEEYQTKGSLRYQEGHGKDERTIRYEEQTRRQATKVSNPPVKNYSSRPNEANYYFSPQTPVYQRPIQPRYSSREPSEKYSASSKERKVFGSIVKRDELKNNSNLKEVVLRAKNEQRKRINSYKSEEKAHSIYQEPSYQPKKKQVYMDLIGHQHSLQDEESPDPKRWSQQQEEYEYERKSKNHKKPQIINKFSATNQSTHYNTRHTMTPTNNKLPKTLQANPQNGKLYCNIHQDEEIIYFCLQCKLLICSECALYGQHKDHNIHTLKKAAFKLKETLYSLITELNSYLLVQEQKQQLLMEQIKQIKIESNKEKEKVKFTFQNFIKNVQNKYAQILELLEQSQTKALSRFTLELEKAKQKCAEFFDKKNQMKNLFENFANNHLAAPSCQYESTNIINPLTNNLPTQLPNQDRNVRAYRQFDDFFEENSMNSEQKNFFNTNIEELQSKISDYEEYVMKLKPEYHKTIYPTFYNREQHSTSKRNSASKTKDFFRESLKSRHQSQELHESLKFSETSLLIEQSRNTPQKNGDANEFLSQKDFISENNMNSLNLMIEKELQLSEWKEKLKIANVDTITESIKQIEEIIKQFRIQYRGYEVKAGEKRIIC